jgi:hypothetical protein
MNPPPPLGVGPVLTPGLSFEQTWQTLPRQCFMPKISALAIWVFLKEDLLSFFFRLPWQPEFCMELNSLNNF